VTTVVLFALLAGAGAVARAAATGRWNRPGRFPLGTLAVNVLGCLALGALRGSGVAPPALTVVGTGMIGAFTTFSALTADAWGLVDAGRRRPAAVYVALSLVAGIAAAAAGQAVTS
jgi:fluoride exporter